MHINYGMYNMTDIHKNEVKDLVEKNLTVKMDSYLLPYTQKGSPVSLAVKINKNKRGKYDGNLILMIGTKPFIYTTPINGFRIVADIINHAFDRFKEQLSHK